MRVCCGLLALALGACSTPAETSWSADPQELRIEEEAGAPEVAEQQLAPYLCFRIDTESGLEDYVPTIRATLSLAAHRWGWPILVSDECESVVTVGDVERSGGASHQSWRPSGSESTLSAAHLGGRSVITLDRDLLESGRVVDDGSCLPGEEAYLLASILTHELGHALKVPHSDDESSPMFEKARRCWDEFPTRADSALALRRTAP